MAQYSIPSTSEIKTILAEFIKQEVTSYKLLSGGSQNTNYHIETTDQAYVLTICEEKSIQETEQLVYLLEHLSDYNFPSSKVIRSVEGQPIILWNNKAVMLKGFLEGKIMDRLPAHLLELCGQRLAQLHRIPSPDYIPRDLCFGLNHFPEVQLYAPDSDFDKWLKEIMVLVNSVLTPDLPKTLIHSDIFNSNVIINTDEMDATIMDFEDACHYFRIFDIGMMIVGLCNHNSTVDLKEASFIVKGYQSESALSTIEKECLQAFTVYAAAATAFWRHKQFNYTNPDDDQKDRYMEMRDVADFVQGLEIKEFSKILGSTIPS